jgi:hypothetical protein
MPSSDIELRAEERAVVLEAAGMIAESARNNAAWSQKIPDAISVSEVKEWANGIGVYIRVDLSVAPEARAFEYGSGIRSTHKTQSPKQEGPGGYIIIEPVNFDHLSFRGTNEWAGMWINVPPMGGGVVHHPGVAPRPFIGPAIDEHRPMLRDLLKRAVRQSVSKTIRTSWYHSL